MMTIFGDFGFCRFLMDTARRFKHHSISPFAL